MEGNNPIADAQLAPGWPLFAFAAWEADTVRKFLVGIAISSLNIRVHALGTILPDRAVQRYWGEELQEHPRRERFLLLADLARSTY